jgi:IS5 family transposase
MMQCIEAVRQNIIAKLKRQHNQGIPLHFDSAKVWHTQHRNRESEGHPISFELLPAAWDELTHVQDLLAVLPEGSTVVADKGYISQLDELLAYRDGGIRLVAKYRKNMRGNSPEDAKLIRQHRSMIETVNSQLEKMGLQRLHARSNAGIALKVLAYLLALTFTNL